eukprot:288636_1
MLQNTTIHTKIDEEEHDDLPYQQHISPPHEQEEEHHHSPLLIKSKQQKRHGQASPPKPRTGNSIQSSSISLSPNCIQFHDNNLVHNISHQTSDSQFHEVLHNDINKMDSSIKQRNSDPFVYFALKQSLHFLMENISDSWKSKWSLKFDEVGLEHYFKIYFAHRYLLSNQAAFLMFALFYIIILFIFDVESRYEWISVMVHCLLIIMIFIALVLSLTDQFKIYIHRLTAMVLFVILIGLDIQSILAEMPISAQSVLTMTLVLLGCGSFLSIRYHHLLILFVSFVTVTNIAFVIIVLKWHNRIEDTKFTYFVWFNMLLIFAMCCTAHLVRLFEMQERKLFLRVLRQMKETRQSLQRQLTVYETVSIAQLIDNDRTGHDNDVLDRVLHQFIVMGGLLQHLPDIAEDEDSPMDDEEEVDMEIEMNDMPRAPVSPMNDVPRHSRQPRVCKLAELPDFYNPYPFVPFGYRIEYDYKDAIRSLFEWHNETVNMWTEIVPLILNVFCLSFFVSNDALWSDQMKVDDKCVFSTGAFLILILRPFCSILAHTFYPISKKAHDFWWRVDYASICVTMFCEGAVSGNYVFSCNNQLKILFFTFVTCMFISTMLSTLVSHSMQIRAASFCLFVCFATGCPFLYQWISFAQSQDRGAMLMNYLILWTIAYILAMFALIIKSLWFPERCCKHRAHCLSYVGASHQIWHLLINSCLSLSVYTWVVYLRYKYDGNLTC